MRQTKQNYGNQRLRRALHRITSIQKQLKPRLNPNTIWIGPTLNQIEQKQLKPRLNPNTIWIGPRLNQIEQKKNLNTKSRQRPTSPVSTHTDKTVLSGEHLHRRDKPLQQALTPTRSLSRLAEKTRREEKKRGKREREMRGESGISEGK